MKVYRVWNWDELYENHRSRGLKKVSYLVIPDLSALDAYPFVVEGEQGAAFLGCWIALINRAAQCPQRGLLLQENGRPHTPRSLAALTRLPAALWEQALARFEEPEIGWLEAVEISEETVDGGATRRETPEIRRDPAQSGATPRESEEIPRDPARPGAKHPKSGATRRDPARNPQNPAKSEHVEESSVAESRGEERSGEEGSGGGAEGTDSPPPRPHTPKPPYPEQTIAKARAQLQAYVQTFGWIPEPEEPDDELVEQVLDAAGGSTELLNGALMAAFRAQRRPTKSWGYFPPIVREFLLTSPRGMRIAAAIRRQEAL